jgi:ribose/xylose/arabinose/galactoside ABC-type transport system permease subunit
LIALVGRLNQTFGVGKEFDVITAAVLGGTSLFGGVGGAFGAVVGSVLVQMVQAGMVFVKVNLYLQPMVLAGIIFIAVFFDSLREGRLLKLKRRFIRIDISNEPQEGGKKT